MRQSQLELIFREALRRAGCEMVEQYQFDETGRKWRLDFAHQESKIATEIDGGEFAAGAHNRGARMARDYEKRNAALEQGWAVFQLTGQQVAREAHLWAPRVAAMIAGRMDAQADR